MERYLADTALAASMEGAGQDQSPVAADETNLLEGARLYQQNDCMRCHGAFGQGATALSKLMYPHIPPLFSAVERCHGRCRGRDALGCKKRHSF
jgi:cytochrome c